MCRPTLDVVDQCNLGSDLWTLYICRQSSTWLVCIIHASPGWGSGRLCGVPLLKHGRVEWPATISTQTVWLPSSCHRKPSTSASVLWCNLVWCTQDNVKHCSRPAFHCIILASICMYSNACHSTITSRHELYCAVCCPAGVGYWPVPHWLLQAPRAKTTTGSWGFSCCASVLWNSLPLSLCSPDSISTFALSYPTYVCSHLAAWWWTRIA